MPYRFGSKNEVVRLLDEANNTDDTDLEKSALMSALVYARENYIILIESKLNNL